eukprot:15482720-Alexandrium_andersonii.AAC.1
MHPCVTLSHTATHRLSSGVVVRKLRHLCPSSARNRPSFNALACWHVFVCMPGIAPALQEVTNC